jgi:hypothetical protein
MKAISRGQLDGFPPADQLKTVYVEHDIQVGGGCVWWVWACEEGQDGTCLLATWADMKGFRGQGCSGV